MINEKDKKIIDDFLKEQNFNFDEYDDFIEYIQARGMLNQDKKWVDRIVFTMQNLKKLYFEYVNPVKKISKKLGMNYKELAEQIGYTEAGIRNAVSKDKISEQLKRTLELLLENKLKKLDEKDLLYRSPNFESYSPQKAFTGITSSTNKNGNTEIIPQELQKGNCW
ncbi:hypothetical protein [Campylobacter sp. JMF_08 NE1]|uniref:hypothetical protein n=1 Tax=Campylobacter sp. JMF_08 NE1 TaxID=2983821 RepID=UPI0022E9B5A1|nr:hypothetical protein [Campylobacter sp. JMF_08 NE1]MDA3048225.1 hypothetical protein [Campylobacter sp. JMF_08 NE1]